jgi:hypothetical protein
VQAPPRSGRSRSSVDPFRRSPRNLAAAACYPGIVTPHSCATA